MTKDVKNQRKRSFIVLSSAMYMKKYKTDVKLQSPASGILLKRRMKNCGEGTSSCCMRF